MAIAVFKKGGPEDFDDFTALPKTVTQEKKWQDLNKAWWEANPMRYDLTEKLAYAQGSKEYYEEIDRRFFSSVWQIMPWDKIPFDNLIDFGSLGQKDVLEIGVGCGSHAQLLSRAAKSFTGIDLTEYATKCSTARLKCFNCEGTIIRADATKMDFPDNSFDFVWSWGVIHHSANTRKILEEINRVLRPGGKVTVMVYHRSFWHTYVRGALYYGILRGEFFRKKSLNQVVQETTDGALARYYTVSEWNNSLSDLFVVKKTLILGSKSQIIPLPYNKTKEFLMSLIPNRLGRFIVNRPFIGFLMVSTFEKK